MFHGALAMATKARFRPFLVTLLEQFVEPWLMLAFDSLNPGSAVTSAYTATSHEIRAGKPGEQAHLADPSMWAIAGNWLSKCGRSVGATDMYGESTWQHSIDRVACRRLSPVASTHSGETFSPSRALGHNYIAAKPSRRTEPMPPRPCRPVRQDATLHDA